jgi:hypothetical protein
VVGDRGYEGDPGYLAHLGAAARADRWDERRPARGSVAADTGGFDVTDRATPTPPGADDGTDDATAGVARRLQGRLDRHLALLDRLRAGELLPGAADLAELADTAHRMRRDTESLLLLAGRDPGTDDERELADLLADAAAATEEPRRVDVGAAPAARIAPGAAVEVAHVLTELLDQATAAHPGARIALGGRLESGDDVRTGQNRAATIEVHVDGAVRHDPDVLGARRAGAAADAISRGSRHGIVLRRPAGTPLGGSGPFASVHCPAAAVTVPAPPAPAPRRPTGPETFSSESFGSESFGSESFGSESFGAQPSYESFRSEPRRVEPPHFEPPHFEPLRVEPLRFEPLRVEPVRSASPPEPALPEPALPEPTLPARINGRDIPGDFLGHFPGDTPPDDRDGGIGGALGAPRGTNGSSAGEPAPPRPPLSSDEMPAYSPSSSSQIDELFGPLLDLPLEPIDDRYATPIFEAIASAWFLEGEPGAEPGGAPAVDWQTPEDDEWREAAARAARTEPAPTTATGLPRRRPGDQLVPPPRGNGPGGSRNGSSNGGPAGERTTADRVPDRVRDRLSTYQRGLEEGRHRAVGAEGVGAEGVGADSPEADDW